MIPLDIQKGRTYADSIYRNICAFCRSGGKAGHQGGDRHPPVRKSTLFDLYRDFLKQDGVSDAQIIAINLEDVAFEDLHNYRALYGYVKARMAPDKMNYIFLDEIQHVEKYEKAVDSLFVQKNADVYITGSNAYFMSGELATLLSGRFVELKMLPLSFAEYVSAFPGQTNREELYRNYVYNSSFPTPCSSPTGGTSMNTWTACLTRSSSMTSWSEKASRIRAC